MTSNWAYNLDTLAQNGILDFDAPSYIMEKSPRYVGKPTSETSPFQGPLPNVPGLNALESDEYVNKKDGQFKNPSWKKWLFGSLALGGIVLGGYKFRAKWMPWVKSRWAKLSAKCSSIKISSIGTSIKNGWNKFVGFFKHKKP